MRKVVLATDLGGTNLRMSAVSIDGDILYRVKNRSPRSSDPNELVDGIINTAKQCIANMPECEIVSNAFAVPGIIDVEKGLIFKSPNLPELDGFKLVDALDKKLEGKVIIENDANAAAVGENWLGASKGVADSIMVTLGTGVGGGIISKGEILRGVDGTAGEIGHINVLPDGQKCGCGSQGCLEQYASATAIARMAKESIQELANKDDLTSEEVFELANDGNKKALEVFRLQGIYLGITLAGLINSLNPEVIVIGGGASSAWELFFPHLRDEVNCRSYKEPAERVKIVKAELADDAGILGVAKLGFEKLL